MKSQATEARGSRELRWPRTALSDPLRHSRDAELLSPWPLAAATLASKQLARDGRLPPRVFTSLPLDLTAVVGGAPGFSPSTTVSCRAGRSATRVPLAIPAPERSGSFADPRGGAGHSAASLTRCLGRPSAALLWVLRSPCSSQGRPALGSFYGACLFFLGVSVVGFFPPPPAALGQGRSLLVLLSWLHEKRWVCVRHTAGETGDGDDGRRMKRGMGMGSVGKGTTR